MRNKLIITIIIIVIGLVWWGCENTISPTESEVTEIQPSIMSPSFTLLEVNGDECCLPPPDGMVGWWTGDGTADDFMGHYNGDLMGDATYASGKVNQAFSLDGVGDYVRIPNNSALEPSVITVDAWVKATSPGTYRYIVVKGADACSRASYAFYTGGSGGLIFYISKSTGGVILSPNADTGVWDGEWHHIAGTYDGSNVRLYVDGSEIGSGSPGVTSIAYGLPSDNDLLIGNYVDCPSVPTNFTGLIDEVEIFNHALTADEIAGIYEAGPAGKCKGSDCTNAAKTTTLYADQGMDVGTVEIITDLENIYVTYQLNGTYSPEWYFTESHLWIGTAYAAISKNAAPGKFPYTGTITGADNDRVEFGPIPFSELGCPLIFAAHAKIETEVLVGYAPVEGCWEDVWQIGDVEGPIWKEPEDIFWLTNYADEFNWVGADELTFGSLSSSQPVFPDPFVIGVNTDSEFPWNSHAGAWDYATDFDVQWDGSLPFGGQLTLSWDPGRENLANLEQKQVFLPELFPSGPAIGDFSYTILPQGIDPAFWYTGERLVLVEDVVIIPPLDDGTHTLNFKHLAGQGALWDWILLQKPCTVPVYETVHESAWGEGSTTFSSEEISKKWGWFIDLCSD